MRQPRWPEMRRESPRAPRCPRGVGRGALPHRRSPRLPQARPAPARHRSARRSRTSWRCGSAAATRRRATALLVAAALAGRLALIAANKQRDSDDLLCLRSCRRTHKRIEEHPSSWLYLTRSRELRGWTPSLDPLSKINVRRRYRLTPSLARPGAPGRGERALALLKVVLRVGQDGAGDVCAHHGATRGRRRAGLRADRRGRVAHWSLHCKRRGAPVLWAWSREGSLGPCPTTVCVP